MKSMSCRVLRKVETRPEANQVILVKRGTLYTALETKRSVRQFRNVLLQAKWSGQKGDLISAAVGGCKSKWRDFCLDDVQGPFRRWPIDLGAHMPTLAHSIVVDLDTLCCSG